jgi:hypothetical protein
LKTVAFKKSGFAGFNLKNRKVKRLKPAEAGRVLEQAHL